MNKIKLNSLNIIKLNNNTYLPYQLHQLPKWFDRNNIDYVNLKGYCYINLNSHPDGFNYNNFKDNLVFHKSFSHTQSR